MTSALVHRLRSYSEAYPLDMFPELTKEEREMLHREHPGFLDRISASMGRHCGKIMDQAADVLEGVPEQQTKPLGEGPHCPTCECTGESETTRLRTALERIRDGRYPAAISAATFATGVLNHKKRIERCVHGVHPLNHCKECD